MNSAAFTRQRILEIFDNKCFYCGEELAEENMELDHIHPKVKGGKHKISNYAPACFSCNRTKRDNLLPKETRTKAFSIALTAHKTIKSEIKAIKDKEISDKKLKIVRIVDPNLKPISIRDVPVNVWRQLKANATLNGESISQRLCTSINLLNSLGLPREVALENAEFRIVPHRTDDSRDDADAWAWKLEAWVDGNLEDATIL
jgi:hypothetical protein